MKYGEMKICTVWHRASMLVNREYYDIADLKYDIINSDFLSVILSFLCAFQPAVNN